MYVPFFSTVISGAEYESPDKWLSAYESLSIGVDVDVDAEEGDLSFAEEYDAAEVDVAVDEACALSLDMACELSDISAELDVELEERFFPTQAPSVNAITKVIAIVSAYVMRDRFFIGRIIQPHIVVYHAISPLRRYRETGKADERQPSQNKQYVRQHLSPCQQRWLFLCPAPGKRLSVHASR